MKKWWIVPAAAIFLAACGNDNATKPTEDDDISVDMIEPEEQPEEQMEATEEPASTVEEEATDEETTEAQPTPSVDELSTYEESAVLAEHIPVDTLKSHVETDNPGTRVILFEDESGKKVYKSVFVKHDQHVKIIDLNDDILVYEGHL
ncbi:hypothetical protein DV702_07545 [Sporosarcina sp. PTS2304]|uniref:hypothetical protein n=1 Tax=Sporosarcina sp. PTS2304 TaxID=2283194 RepID=UPI000E0D83A6|nr:hypothetical protein [Sporosarcina sp. PTS2304]AXH99617.1 hypothetical protein DV702_07545 [Sporosarcina sp. PTS2304]